jgi:GMP synthase (glutamine-hydrolysing)
MASRDRSRSPRGEEASTHEAPEDQQKERVLVIDFGSQVSHLICRRVREANVYCELRSCLVKKSDICSFAPTGIILSGGPHSVYDTDAPHLDKEVWEYLEAQRLPILGICYGLQEMCYKLGGSVEPGTKREFGHADLEIKSALGAPRPLTPGSRLFDGIDAKVPVWMSHGDKVTKLPEGFSVIAATSSCEFAAVESSTRHMWGVQFHPEVTHTPCGARIIKNFVQGICGCTGKWKMSDFAAQQATAMLSKIGDKYCIGAVSGGVDSSVAAALLHKALGDKFKPFLVDTGLLRKDEAKLVKERLEKHIPGLKLKVLDASQRFFTELKGVTEPETKRKIIGRLFIECFEAAVKEMDLPTEQCMLLQGTLYPDVIESTSFKGPSTVIKSHHNVGGLPERMKMGLLEPLRLLFKDEVRTLGRELGIPSESVMRHPFPGPGLGIRIIGEVTEESAKTLQNADDIYVSELRATGHYDKIGQAFAALLPTVKSVGVMGDHRTYENVCVLRAITSTDFMTADWYDMPKDVLAKISNRIINEVKGINRVCYDVSSKPPATIEWE